MENLKKDYDEIIKRLNNGEIISLSFKIAGYNHYNNCKIFQIYEPVNCLQVKLTNDNYESIRFSKFNEDFKLFYLGRKGSFTLKQIWSRVIITEIVEKDK